MTELSWAVEWRGPRGGKYWTGPISEDRAREIFSKKKSGEIAFLLKIVSGIIGPMRQVIHETPAAKLSMYQSLLKDHRKQKIKIDEAIKSCEEKIRELKKQVDQ